MNFLELCKDDLRDVEKEMMLLVEKREKRTFGIIPSFLERGGKRMRPLLLLLFFHAFNGKDLKNAKRMAALIEMFHNFTLIHDDIEDNSRYRRGKPTLHIEYGIPMALNSGDALYTLVLKEISELDMEPSRVVSLMRLCSNAFLQVVEGQGIEISWEQENSFEIKEKDYYHMISKKTGALIALSCEVGAYLAGATEEEQQVARKFGENIGVAFQICDDILNLTAQFEKYKKEIGGDITEGKRTLMVIKTLEIADEKDREVLKEIISSRTTNQKRIEEAISIIKKYGALEYAAEKARLLVEQAQQLLIILKPSPYKTALLQIADYVLTREN
ncbi:MAG: polyprenyl synthetase family protein [Candidatus Bilamarchaeaceae archaeon]